MLFTLKNKFAIDVLKEFYEVILQNSARPLINYYSQENNVDYSCCLTESEDFIGSRFLFKYCFSMITIPKSLYKKLLKKQNRTHDEIVTALLFYNKRLNAFLSNIQNYEYRDIYLADSINDLIKKRQYYIYSYSGIELIDLEIPDIIEHLQNVISLLQTYDNYNIAFLSQNTSSKKNTLNSNHFYCLIKERQAVLLEMFEPSQMKTEARLSIKEPMLVKAFDDYFKEIWDEIAPVNKDKDEVISWILSQINVLKNNHEYQSESDS